LRSPARTPRSLSATRGLDCSAAGGRRGVAARDSLGALAPPPVAQTFADRRGDRRDPRGRLADYNRDLAGTRYSPLAQITVVNVGDIRQAWVYALGRNTTTGSCGRLGAHAARRRRVMYATAADRVVALRAESGAELWRYPLEQGAPSRRGWRIGPGTRKRRADLFTGPQADRARASTARRCDVRRRGEIEMPSSTTVRRRYSRIS